MSGPVDPGLGDICVADILLVCGTLIVTLWLGQGGWCLRWDIDVAVHHKGAEAAELGTL